MRLSVPLLLFVASSTATTALLSFSSQRHNNHRGLFIGGDSRAEEASSYTRLWFSAVADPPPPSSPSVQTSSSDSRRSSPEPAIFTGPLSGEEINTRLEAQLEKLREKDKTSPLLTKEELKIVYEDKHIVVVDKPSGVLTVSGKHGANSIAQSVFDNVKNKFHNADRMVVHRLGMDTSGLLILCKTIDAVRGMNTIFRTRSIQRHYEALVCGHMKRDRGIIDLPIMRDYECPPFVRISTEDHQEALVGLDPDVVGKKLLESPKESLTQYKVIAREELGGHVVTRVELTSISGRTHQLNCHLAAFGHPIVGDTTYGLDGDAAPNGGLQDAELEYLAPNKNRATVEQQQGANAAATNGSCCHAKSLNFRHPVSQKEISLSSDAPF